MYVFRMAISFIFKYNKGMISSLQTRGIKASLFLNIFVWASLAIGFYFLNGFHMTKSQYEVGRGLAGVLTFNSSHLFITYVLFLLPEFKNVAYLKNSQFWLRTHAMTLFWTAYYSWIFYKFSDSHFLFSLFIMPKYAMFMWHGIRQSLGLSKQQSGYVNPRLLSEDNLVVCLWALGNFYLILKFGFGLSFDLSLAAIALALCFLYAAMVLYKYGYEASIQKILYLPRYLLFSLGGISFVFLLSSYILHGLEAVNTFTTMSRRSKDGNGVLILSVLLLIVLAPFVAVLWHYDGVTAVTHIQFSMQTKILFFGISNGLATSHCFMEEKMFRFKEESIRQNIGPLLKSAA